MALYDQNIQIIYQLVDLEKIYFVILTVHNSSILAPIALPLALL